MMAEQEVSFASLQGGPLDNVCQRPIVPDKVHVQSGELLHLITEVPGQGQCFQENLGEDNGGTQIDKDARLEL